MSAGAPVLRADRIVKRFPGVVALHDVSFDLLPGEIHALCGENGAGKSTLIKIMAGIHPHGSYQGTFAIGGQPAAFRSPRDAEAAGIAVIYQELALVEEMTIAENLFLGNEPRRSGLIDWTQLHANAVALLRGFGIELDPTAPVRTLGVGQRQMVEIAKALGKRSRILVLDEPTAALTDEEARRLLEILRDLRRRGISCIYVSHRLDEVFAVADRITILRDGESIATHAAVATSKDEVIRQMVGREIRDLYPRRASAPGETLLEVEDLTVGAPYGEGRLWLDRIAFSVRAGEVLGLGGLMGAGRTALLMHLFGASGKRLRGRVTLAGAPLEDSSTPHQSLARGLALVSEDRKRNGLVLDQSIGFNLSLATLGELTHHGLIDEGEEFQRDRALFQSLRVKAPDLETAVSQLSGGNQQKVVLGKALMTGPKVILLDEPTRGIDVGAKVEIYALINELTAAGKAVVLASSELPELMGMSDRILMLHDGRIGGAFARAEVTPELLLAAAMGSAGPGTAASV